MPKTIYENEHRWNHYQQQHCLTQSAGVSFPPSPPHSRKDAHTPPISSAVTNSHWLMSCCLPACQASHRQKVRQRCNAAVGMENVVVKKDKQPLSWPRFIRRIRRWDLVFSASSYPPPGASPATCPASQKHGEQGMYLAGRGRLGRLQRQRSRQNAIHKLMHIAHNLAKQPSPVIEQEQVTVIPAGSHHAC